MLLTHVFLKNFNFLLGRKLA